MSMHEMTDDYCRNSYHMQKEGKFYKKWIKPTNPFMWWDIVLKPTDCPQNLLNPHKISLNTSLLGFDTVTKLGGS